MSFYQIRRVWLLSVSILDIVLNQQQKYGSKNSQKHNYQTLMHLKHQIITVINYIFTSVLTWT